jgi:hypothetical protein
MFLGHVAPRNIRALGHVAPRNIRAYVPGPTEEHNQTYVLRPTEEHRPYIPRSADEHNL